MGLFGEGELFVGRGDGGEEAGELLVIRRDARGRFSFRIGERAETLGLLDALLDLADAGEIFVELVLVVAAEFAMERAGVFEGEVEDRLLPLVAQQEALL